MADGAQAELPDEREQHLADGAGVCHYFWPLGLCPLQLHPGSLKPSAQIAGQAPAAAL